MVYVKRSAFFPGNLMKKNAMYITHSVVFWYMYSTYNKTHQSMILKIKILRFRYSREFLRHSRETSGSSVYFVLWHNFADYNTSEEIRSNVCLESITDINVVRNKNNLRWILLSARKILASQQVNIIGRYSENSKMLQKQNILIHGLFRKLKNRGILIFFI